MPYAATGRTSNPAVWIGLGALVLALIAVPLLAIFFLGHTTTPTTSGGTPSDIPADRGPEKTPTLGPDGIPVVLYAKAPGNGQVVDQQTAGKIIKQAWELRLEALAHNNVDLLAKFETGVQLDVDRYDCGCDPPPGTPIGAWAASATRQSSYPQHFLGQVTIHVAGSEASELLAFTRTSASQPWKISAVVGFVPVPTSGQVLESVPAPQHLAVDPSALSVDAAFASAEATDMNSYWQYWANSLSEQPGSYLSAGYGALTQRGQATVNAIRAARGAGVDLSYRYADDSRNGPMIFPGTTKPGSAIVCGGTTYTKTYKAKAPGATFHQGTGVAALIDPTMVPEGDYRQVEIQGFRPWCMMTTQDHRVWAYLGFTGKHVVGTDK